MNGFEVRRSVAELAEIHERTRVAIQSRLGRPGLIERSGVCVTDDFLLRD